jgi:hypothetical protein
VETLTRQSAQQTLHLGRVVLGDLRQDVRRDEEVKLRMAREEVNAVNGQELIRTLESRRQAVRGVAIGAFSRGSPLLGLRHLEHVRAGDTQERGQFQKTPAGDLAPLMGLDYERQDLRHDVLRRVLLLMGLVAVAGGQADEERPR